DEPGRVADHPGQPLLAGELGGDDDVALVLPALIVHDDDRLAGAQFLQRGGDVSEAHGSLLSVVNSSIRSTWRATMSVSMLTCSPTPRAPRVVAVRVSGMSDTSNQSPPTALTVREMPSTAIDPLFATKWASSEGREKRSTRQTSPSVTLSSSLVPSMWPCTMWPPRRSPTWAARSRLTRVPGWGCFRVLIAMVWAMTSAVNQSSPWSMTVRHTPFTEMESPCFASETASGPRTVIRAASVVGSQASTSPISSMIPVNTRLLLPGERRPAGHRPTAQ